MMNVIGTEVNALGNLNFFLRLLISLILLHSYWEQFSLPNTNPFDAIDMNITFYEPWAI